MKEIYDDLIKPPSYCGFEGARSESGEVVISYTSLIRYMPPYVEKLLIVTT